MEQWCHHFPVHHCNDNISESRMKWKQKMAPFRVLTEKRARFVSCCHASFWVFVLVRWPEHGSLARTTFKAAHLFKFWSPRTFVKLLPELYAARQHGSLSILNDFVGFLPLPHVAHQHRIRWIELAGKHTPTTWILYIYAWFVVVLFDTSHNTKYNAK